ncbi:hypothetical protein GE061_012717 [Apolygus lucorum]|uniref:Uncharacterized protein n=1 Tax=Apolygus lucorum TaxID=248454 RepID=A0A6A4JUV2_APOLU|nr:hypothetical protein GE061_012717 [Apolygus lucorum]
MSALHNILLILCVIVLLEIRRSDGQSRTEAFVKSHIDYMGLFYAGHGEFPWVVEIRTQASQNQSEQEDWSVGNLIGPRYVLTTCNAVATFEYYGPNWDVYVVKSKKPTLYKVMYTPDSPYHGPRWYINRYAKWSSYNTELKTGTRQILRMGPHPQCYPKRLQYFFGIVELSDAPIKPFRLFVTYAPSELDYNELKKKWYFMTHKSAFQPATIASWGRKFKDRYTPMMLLHFKIKYKIRVVEWSTCEREFKKLAWSDKNTALERNNNTLCMQVHDLEHTMGSVCDHDRGAPVVWEGIMIGMVITAAKFEFCSQLQPLPFVVQSIDDAVVYWANVERHVLQRFIDNSSHVFPGLFGLSVSPPSTTTTMSIWMTTGLLLLQLLANR